MKNQGNSQTSTLNPQLATHNSQFVPPGYKLTEVGVIPEDWEVIPLGKGLSGKPGYGINAPAVPYSDRLPAYIRITDITENGRYDPSNPVSVKSADSEIYFLMSMRSGQPGINGNEYASFEFMIPPTIDEQTAIATVISDMDAEIAALVQRRTKTKDIKQAMMQELLTGKTRVI